MQSRQDDLEGGVLEEVLDEDSLRDLFTKIVLAAYSSERGLTPMEQEQVRWNKVKDLLDDAIKTQLNQEFGL